MHWFNDYRGKRLSAQEAVRLIKSGDRVFTSGNVATPQLLLRALDLVLLLLEEAFERPVELVEHLGPAHLALGDVVELVLHPGGEPHVHHLGEVLHEEVGHDLADVLGIEPAVVETDVLPVEQRGDDGEAPGGGCGDDRDGLA